MKNLAVVLFFLATLLQSAPSTWRSVLFPSEKGAVARTALAATAALVGTATCGEIFAKGYKFHAKKYPKAFRRAHCCFAARYLFSRAAWRSLGQDLQKLRLPPTRAGTNRFEQFYQARPGLCWATGLSAAYTATALLNLGFEIRKSAENEKLRLAAEEKRHKALIAKFKGAVKAAIFVARTQKAATETRSQKKQLFNAIFSGATKAFVAWKKKLKNIRSKPKVVRFRNKKLEISRPLREVASAARLPKIKPDDSDTRKCGYYFLKDTGLCCFVSVRGAAYNVWFDPITGEELANPDKPTGFQPKKMPAPPKPKKPETLPPKMPITISSEPAPDLDELLSKIESPAQMKTTWPVSRVFASSEPYPKTPQDRRKERVLEAYLRKYKNLYPAGVPAPGEEPASDGSYQPSLSLPAPMPSHIPEQKRRAPAATEKANQIPTDWKEGMDDATIRAIEAAQQDLGHIPGPSGGKKMYAFAAADEESYDEWDGY